MMHANNKYKYENWRMNSVIIPVLFDSVLVYFSSKLRRQDVLTLTPSYSEFWFNQNNWRSMVLAQLWLYLPSSDVKRVQDTKTTRLNRKSGRCLRSITKSFMYRLRTKIWRGQVCRKLNTSHFKLISGFTVWDINCEMHGWLTLLLQHDLNKPKQLNSELCSCYTELYSY